LLFLLRISLIDTVELKERIDFVQRSGVGGTENDFLWKKTRPDRTFWQTGFYILYSSIHV
jgi:hypothetical protein